VGGVVFALASVLAPALALNLSAGGLALLGAVSGYAAVTIWLFVQG
jgi:hypothetical protein